MCEVLDSLLSGKRGWGERKGGGVCAQAFSRAEKASSYGFSVSPVVLGWKSDSQADTAFGLHIAILSL